MNIFIIYALRKLNKLSNISFWLLYWLSISDLFIGLSGFTLDISFISCLSRFNCYWVPYIYAVRSYFTGYSARLTIIIAVDRSIRMISLYNYNNIMTKRKANIVLVLNGILGIIKFAGSLGPYKRAFEMSYGIFHVICIFSGCILYIIIYCITKKKVSDLHLNMQRRQIAIANEAILHRNVPDPLSQLEAHDTVEGILIQGTSRGKGRRQTEPQSLRSQKRNSERNQLAVPGKSSSGSSTLSNELPERSMDIILSINDAALKCIPSRNSNMADHNQGGLDAASHSSCISTKAERTMKNSKDPNHRRRNDNEVGRAMLFITMAMISCYVPIVADDLLRMRKADNTVLEHFAKLLLLANATCNAIILTVFSRDIRNLAKRLL